MDRGGDRVMAGMTRGRPFRLGTTSFIFPDHIIPNVRKIGGWFDEIELLIFESRPLVVLPTAEQIQTLCRLSDTLNVRYNIHLPTDVSLTHPCPDMRQQAADTMARVVALCAPLNPTTHTLHLERNEPGHGKKDNLKAASGKANAAPAEWTDRALDGLSRLVSQVTDPGKLSVETLSYPPARLTPMIAAYPVRVCLDAGHHFYYGFDAADTMIRFQDRVSIIHLHGVTGEGRSMKDHTGLDRLPPRRMAQVITLLSGFNGTVSLEVFNRGDLAGSLAVLSRYFNDIPTGLPG